MTYIIKFCDIHHYTLLYVSLHAVKYTTTCYYMHHYLLLYISLHFLKYTSNFFTLAYAVACCGIYCCVEPRCVFFRLKCIHYTCIHISILSIVFRRSRAHVKTNIICRYIADITICKPIYYTPNDHNVQINNLSSLNRQIFFYHCILFWNNSPIDYRTL